MHLFFVDPGASVIQEDRKTLANFEGVRVAVDVSIHYVFLAFCVFFKQIKKVVKFRKGSRVKFNVEALQAETRVISVIN